MDDRTIDDPRTLVPPYLRAQPPNAPPPPPPHLPPVEEIWRGADHDGPRDFWVFLLAAGTAIGLVGLLRLAWNVYEGELWEYGTFWGFFVLDKSLGYFTCFSNFAIAAAVWRWRAR